MLTRMLRNLIGERLAAREQVILFLNRRGYAPVLICPRCGEVVRCEHCEVSMTWHLRRTVLICHWCSSEKRRPELCPRCRNGALHELGMGTERVVAAMKKLFPDAIVARMDADSTSKRGALETLLHAFRRKQIDVLVGTQMLAKGHDFPNVTLVGVVSADTGLFVPDYRAAERTFQLLSQVAGRAGRAEKEGLVVFQTLCPENYAIAAASALDYERFVQQELAFRKATGYPPFSRLIRVLLEGTDPAECAAQAAEVKTLVTGVDGVEVLGPAPAIQAKVKDRHRVHMVLKCFTPASFRAAMQRVETVEDRSTHRLRVTLDVDPGALL